MGTETEGKVIRPIKPSKLSRNTRAVMAVIGSILCLVSIAAGFYGAGNMAIAPMAQRFGVSVADVVLFYTYEVIGIVIASLLGAKLIAKINIHYTVVVGTVLGAAGLLLMGIGNSLPVVYLGAGLVGFGIIFSGPAILQTTISAWFYTGRATLIGIVGMTEAVGITGMSFLAAHLKTNSVTGYSESLIISSVIVLVFGLVAGLVFMRGVPADYGFVPVGADENTYNDTQNNDNEVPGISAKEAYRATYFWLFLIGMFVINIGYALLYPQIAPHTTFLGFTTIQAALLVSTASWAKGLIKIAYGIVGDRFGLRLALCGSVSISIICGILYVFTTNFAVLIFCVFGIGAIGGLTGSGTLVMSRMLGPKDLLKVATIPHAANGLGGIFGPILFKVFYDGTASSYATVGTLAVICLAIYFGTTMFSLKKENMFENKRAL